jgi:hypothetical protein
VIKLTKNQKDQLIGVAVGTVGLIGALWYLGVTAKQAELSKTEKNTAQMVDTLKRAETTMRQGDEVEERLKMRSDLLEKREAMLAPDRDAYVWVIGVINDFIKSRKGVNIFNYSQAEVADFGSLPGFPYKWATFHIGGSGYYHELGAFFRDLENNYPYFRVQNLEITANTTVGGEPEKLSVSFELIVPVKPSDTK